MLKFFSHKKLLQSIFTGTQARVENLPDHLKHIYLGDDETLPVIISKRLAEDQEKRLAIVLKEHKTATGWTLADIKGINKPFNLHA